MQGKTILNDRTVLSVSGPQASDFLQGLITNDMGRLEREKAVYAGLLTPQGKILFDFIVVRVGDDSFYLDCATVRGDDLVKRLSLYRLRAKVEIAPTALGVAAIWGENPPPSLPQGATHFVDPRNPKLGHRVIAPLEELQANFPNEDAASYHAYRLLLGIPDSGDLPPDTIFALDAGFEELKGVSFTKGCYVGQEVTSRMKHRTSARKRFFIVETAQDHAQGATIEAGGREIGKLGYLTDNVALALLRLDRVSEAIQEDHPITIEGKAITLRTPVWLDVSIKSS